MLIGRAATSFGSWSLSVPAVAFRGLMNGFSPAAVRCLFMASKSARCMNASPRTSIECREADARAEAERQGTDGAQIRGDVVPLRPVAARCALHKHPVPVPERDGHAVELQLGHVHRSRILEAAAHAPVEVPYLLFGIGIREAEHRGTWVTVGNSFVGCPPTR